MEGAPKEAAPTPADVQRIAALPDPVVRNLEITHCYSRLAGAFAARTGEGANWCTYATWASRQAGQTIRGEDMLRELERRLGKGRWLLHPLDTVWRRLLRRGLFRRDTRLGRLVEELHTPFDAFERASEAVARGNLKVFEEIGLAFARYLAECPPDAPPRSFERFLEQLRPGEPPEGQGHLRLAFTRYERLRSEDDPVVRTQLAVLANLEIGLHEQTRLQPEIHEALEAGSGTKRDLGLRVLARLAPSSLRWWRALRGPLAAALGIVAAGLQRASRRLAREVVTESLMVLSLPGRVLALGTHLPDAYPDALVEPTDAELTELLARFESVPPAPDDCGARDWADLRQRMHYIVHLFCAFHLRTELAEPPFTAEQVAALRRGAIPDGVL